MYLLNDQNRYRIRYCIKLKNTYMYCNHTSFPAQRGGARNKDNGMITTDTNMVLLHVLYNAQQ